MAIETTPVSISTLTALNGLDGRTLRKQYKEVISGNRNLEQSGHAGDYILFPDNIGGDMSLDETGLSNGDFYTLMANKAARGRKGALVAMVRGVATDTVSSVLKKIPLRKHLQVRMVTTDLSSAMMLTVRNCFPAGALSTTGSMCSSSYPKPLTG